nr:xylulose kinase-1 [Tanacetum cinerariifolium]
MSLTFAETHNMVAYLTKSDASEGFNQIINFLNGSSLKYALTVNPNIYVSYIKQFWTTFTVKKVNDVTRLQALVDKKNVVVTEATIRDALRLDDAKGVECLPNEAIFAELASMGYEKPSTKLMFYKAFFSSQLNFLNHTILQFGDLSTHNTKYASLALTQKVFANMRRVGKGFSKVETPLFEGMLVAQEVEEGDADENVEDVHAGDATEGDVSAANDEVPTGDEKPSIPSPTPPTPPPQPSQDVPSTSQVGTAQRIDTCDDNVMDDVSNQGRMIAGMDLDDDGRTAESQAEIYKIDLDHSNKVLSMKEDKYEPTKVQEVVDVVNTAKIITEVVTAASETITAASTNITTADAQVPAAITTTTSKIIHSEAKSKDKGKEILVEEPKPLKKKPRTEAQARKNLMVYLKNIAGFKMDCFKGMSYDDIRPVFEKYFDSNVAFLQKTKEQIDEEESRALKRINETLANKTAKRKKLDEEVGELKRHLQIVPNEDDDVYTEATPLARKVPVVDYEIYNENNKPYFKIIRADGTHQLYIITFTTTQLILLVERKYPLTKFTLNQMLNNVRFEVEEESEVSLELLSFGVDVAEEFEENMLSV